MTDLGQYTGLLVALGAGLLIGAQRGWAERTLPEGQRMAGVRTFGLAGLYGGALAWLAGAYGPGVAIGGWVALGALVVAGYWQSVGAQGDRGVTTEVALLLTAALGGLAVAGGAHLAAAAAVVTALLLELKPRLHHWLEVLREEELYGALKLLLISVVVLPVLPDRGFGPWQALNPWQIWWMVVLIAAIGFVGYVAARLVGPRRGLLATALVGGLVASTAVTLSYARFGRAGRYGARVLAAGVVAASATMFARLLVLVAVVAPELAVRLAPPLACAAAAGAGVVAWLWRGTDAAPGELAGLRNPFELRPALEFGGLLALIMLAAKGLLAWLGAPGTYLLAAVAGLTDTDAVTLSLASLAGGELPMRVALLGIVLAAVVNTAVKVGLVVAIERGQMARMVASGGLAMVVAAGIGLMLVPA